MKNKVMMSVLAAGGLLLLAGCQTGPKFEEVKMGQYNLLKQKGGPTLGYSPKSGVKLLDVDGYKFKDLNDALFSPPADSFSL